MKKIISIVTGISVAVMLMGTSVPASAATAAELQAMINSLMSQIQSLQTQLSTAQSGSTTSAFTVSLGVGARSDAVKAVQNFLIGKGKLAAGLNTGYYGALTVAAVKAYQTSKGVNSTGYWGPLTRAAANAEGGVVTPTTSPAPTTTVTPVAGTGLTVTSAYDNPAAAIIASGTAFNSGVKISLTAGYDGQVKVTGLTVKKAGISANTYFSGIDIIDSTGKRHGNVASSITDDNTVIFNFPSDPIVIAAGTTGALTVRFNVTTSGTSGTVVFGVSAITTDGATVSGTLPVWGNTMQLTSGSSNVATVYLDEQAVNASGVELNVNTTSAQDIAKFSVNEYSSKEDIKLEKLTIYNNGTAADSDYKDVELVAPDGTILATSQPASKYIVFDLTANPYTISKGLTKNFTIRAKLMDGASRTIQFIVYNDYDLQVKGVSSNALILATANAGGTDTAFPIGNTAAAYNRVTIGSGTVTFNKAADSPSAAVSVGDQNVVLAKYDIKANGENMEIRALEAWLEVTDASGTDVTLTGTVYVKFNDQTIWSGSTTTTGLMGTTATESATLVALAPTYYPVLTAGTSATITVVGTIGSAPTANDTVQVRLDVTSVKRLITNDITDPTVNATDSNTRTVKGLNLVIRTLDTPVAASVVSGTNSFELARFDFDATASGENVRISTIKVTDTKAGTNAAYTDIANLKLYNTSDMTNAIATTTSNSVNANENTFTFATPITVSNSAVTHLVLKGDIVARSADSGATETHTYKIANTTGHITATGATTGTSLDYTTHYTMPNTPTGQAMTIVASGQLTVGLVSGTGKSPSTNQNVTVGTQGNVFFAFKLTSQYEAQKVTSLTLKASAAGGGTLKIGDLKEIGLYAESAGAPAATPFATASQFTTCTLNVCTTAWTSNDNLLPSAVQPGVPATIYVKANVGAEGQSTLGDNFMFEIADAYGTDGTDGDVISKGAYTGATGTIQNADATPVIAGGISYISPFTVAVEGISPTSGSSTTTTITTNTTLARFKVTNNGSAQITLTNAKFYDSGSHTGTSARYTLFASGENSSDYTANTLEASGADESANVLDYGSLTSTTTINGGAYRYLTLQLSTATSVATGDSFSFSVASLGDLKYSVTEANLGYDGEADGDITATLTGLNISGTPAVGTMVKQ